MSLWLKAGVPATQVAEWAGHSVNVLLRVYASCIVGHDDVARRHIQDALSATGQERDPKLPHAFRTDSRHTPGPTQSHPGSVDEQQKCP